MLTRARAKYVYALTEEATSALDATNAVFYDVFFREKSDGGTTHAASIIMLRVIVIKANRHPILHVCVS